MWLRICFFACICCSLKARENFISKEYIDSINSEQIQWEAGQNFDPNTPIEKLRNLVGKDKSPIHEDEFENADTLNEVPSFFPDSFDCRKRWPKCLSIGMVHDQGNCQSAWAIAPASTFTDRLCILSDANITDILSAGYLLTCCHLCGRGCDGGWDDAAWHFFQRHGIPTGGLYGSDQGCHPYPVHPCDHTVTNNTVPGCSTSSVEKTPPCRIKCSNANYRVPFKKDLHKGVYQVSSTATFVGYHAVKVIGWGIENRIPYWLAVNSWGKNWGDKGLFKIRILRNGINFENKFTTGLPFIE